MPAASPPPCLQRGAQTVVRQQSRPGKFASRVVRGNSSAESSGTVWKQILRPKRQGPRGGPGNLRGNVLEPPGVRFGSPGGRFGTLGEHLGDPGPPGRPHRTQDRKRLRKVGSRALSGTPPGHPFRDIFGKNLESAMSGSFLSGVRPHFLF